MSAWLAERVVDRERELREVRVELAQARERGDESLRALSALADDLEAVRRQARGQATRIRLRALREAAELAGGWASWAMIQTRRARRWSSRFERRSSESARTPTRTTTVTCRA